MNTIDLGDTKKFLVPYRYIIIDLKSFYASVECIERGMDPMTTNLVVSDPERSKGTICLAITPALKALGVKNRCRLYEIPDTIPYIIAEPRMQLYINYSAKIYEIYLKYLAKEHIHVYSIDEAFMDLTKYLKLYNKSARDIGIMIRDDVLNTTGIPATCGIGTNLYLAKIALDITAKHTEDRIGELNEESFKRTLWKHRPLTDFWRIGPGTERKLAKYGIYNMYDIAHADENLLYRLFGVDAELLIDHAWGRETTTMEDIKNYSPKNHSISTGQVLLRDYSYEEAVLVVKEMTDLLCLELVGQSVITDSITLYIGYSHQYNFPPTGGSISLSTPTNSAMQIIPKMEQLYRETTMPLYPIRRINLSANRLIDEAYRQYDLFIDPVKLDRERNLQQAVNDIKGRYGKNAILKGMNLFDCGTTITRNMQIGGHKSNGSKSKNG